MQLLTNTTHYLSLQVDLRTCTYKSFERYADKNATLAFGINHTIFGHSKGIRKDDTGFHSFGSYTDLRPCLCIRDGGLVSTIKPNNPYWDIEAHQYMWQAGPSVIEWREFGVPVKHEKFESSFIRNENFEARSNYLIAGNTATGKLIVALGTDISLKEMCTHLCNTRCQYAMICNSEHIYFRLSYNDLNVSIGKLGFGLQIEKV